MLCYFWETCLKSHAGFLHTGFKQNALPQFVLFQELTRQARSTSERFAMAPKRKQRSQHPVTREPRNRAAPADGIADVNGELNDSETDASDDFVYDSSSEIDETEIEIEGRRQRSPTPPPREEPPTPTIAPEYGIPNTFTDFTNGTPHLADFRSGSTSQPLHLDMLNNTYIGPFNPEWEDIAGFSNTLAQRAFGDDDSASSRRQIYRGNLMVLDTIRSSLASAVWLLLLPVLTQLSALIPLVQSASSTPSSRDNLAGRLQDTLRRVAHVKTLAKGSSRGESWAQSKVHIKYAEKAFNGRPAPFADYNTELINARNTMSPPQGHSSSFPNKGKQPASNPNRGGPVFARRTDGYPRTPGAICTYCDVKGHTEEQCMKKKKDTLNRG